VAALVLAGASPALASDANPREEAQVLVGTARDREQTLPREGRGEGPDCTKTCCAQPSKAGEKGAFETAPGKDDLSSVGAG
jgi:hypothetical protein